MVAYHAPMGGTRGKRSQPIIKNGSQTNQQRKEGNGYRSQDPVWNERNDHRSSRSQQKVRRYLGSLDSI